MRKLVAIKTHKIQKYVCIFMILNLGIKQNFDETSMVYILE